MPRRGGTRTRRSSHNRAGVKKKRAIRFGRKIVRVHVGDTQTIISMHEELLCARSPYFKFKLQANRKPIQGECPICHDVLDLGTQDITFCKSSCGVNMHCACMASWEEEKTSAGHAITCPMCRAVWDPHTDDQILRLFKLNEKSMEMYSEWLYTGHISWTDEADTEEEFDVVNRNLIQAYITGIKLGDAKFRTAIMHTMLEVAKDVQGVPGAGAISFAYDGTKEGSKLRKLLVALYVQTAKEDWFTSDDWTVYPRRFVRDLTVGFIQKRGKSKDWDLNTMKKKHVEENEEECEIEEIP